MSAVHAGSRSAVEDSGPLDAGRYASAILNILEDSAEEKARVADTQRAILNILEDAAQEQARLADTQRAILNILEDAAQEQARLADTQRAILNILEDSADEKARIADTQRAILNILEDSAEEKAVNKDLEAFSYSVSHDLRAPLRSIDGFSQALLEDYGGTLDEQGQDYLHRVRAATQRMGHLIDEMLALSRVTRSEMRREMIDLSALARSVIDELQRAEPQCRPEVSIQPGLRAQGDPQLLRILLANLLSNAWKFSGRQPQPRIEFGAMRDADGLRTYFVRDNGVGFDMAYADRLFGAFQRLHSSAEFPGSGVGLATVQRIVVRHGGQVRAEGAVDEGATFSFTLSGWGDTEAVYGR